MANIGASQLTVTSSKALQSTDFNPWACVEDEFSGSDIDEYQFEDFEDLDLSDHSLQSNDAAVDEKALGLQIAKELDSAATAAQLIVTVERYVSRFNAINVTKALHAVAKLNVVVSAELMTRIDQKILVNEANFNARIIADILKAFASLKAQGLVAPSKSVMDVICALAKQKNNFKQQEYASVLLSVAILQVQDAELVTMLHSCIKDMLSTMKTHDVAVAAIALVMIHRGTAAPGYVEHFRLGRSQSPGASTQKHPAPGPQCAKWCKVMRSSCDQEFMRFIETNVAMFDAIATTAALDEIATRCVRPSQKIATELLERILSNLGCFEADTIINLLSSLAQIKAQNSRLHCRYGNFVCFALCETAKLKGKFRPGQVTWASRSLHLLQIEDSQLLVMLSNVPQVTPIAVQPPPGL